MDVSFIISNIVLQLVYYVGVIFLIGFAIAILNRVFYWLLNQNQAVCYATGFIGTPIHELSHAIMCFPFGHKINELKLFQIDPESGVLGYVNHSYNRRNIWAIIGNYFIGVAPIIGGSAVLFLIMKLLVPTTASEITLYIEDFSTLLNRGVSSAWFSYVYAMFLGVLKSILAEASANALWIVFIVISICIALHMNLSGADIKGALPALPFLLLALAAVNFILGLLLPKVYSSFLTFMNSTGTYLLGIMLLSVTMSVICVAVTAGVKYSIKGIAKIISRFR